MAHKADCLDESHYGPLWVDKLIAFAALVAAALPQSEPTQTIHSEECWRWHHKCAIARIEETEELREALKAELERTLTDEQISMLWHQSGEQPFKFARMLLK